MSDGFFGNLFDFNHDGKLSGFEQAADFGAFMGMMDSIQQQKIANSGLDANKLDNMSDSERREALEKAGLDPNDFNL